MKTVYLAIILGVMLLTSTLGSSVVSSYASPGQGVKVLAKEKQGMILLMVKNEQSKSINTIKLTLLDGDITNVRSSQGWTGIKSPDSKSITLTTGSVPIKAQGNAMFFVGATNINSIISWSAVDRFGATIDADSARIIFRQTLAKIAPDGKELTYITNARSLAITTDKIFYSKSDKMIISGVLDPNTHVVITIYAPNGQKIKIMQGTDPTGSFKALHLLQNAVSGTYRVKVSQTDGYAETTFKVL